MWGLLLHLGISRFITPGSEFAATHSCSSAVDDFTKYAVMHWKPENQLGLNSYYLATKHLQLCKNKDSIFTTNDNKIKHFMCKLTYIFGLLEDTF